MLGHFHISHSTQVQEEALSRIGELSVINPGHIYPPLRTILANHVRNLTMALSASTTSSTLKQQLVLQQQQQQPQQLLPSQTQAAVTQAIQPASDRLAQSGATTVADDPEQAEVELQRQRLQSELQHKERSCRQVVLFFP